MSGGVYTNSLPTPAIGTQVDHLTGIERAPVDTQLSSGESPQSVGATMFDMAAMIAAGMVQNNGTVSAGSVTLNTRSGFINTGSLNTAVGSTSSFTLVNSLATSGAAYSLGLASGTNTTPGAILSAATIATSGTLTVTIKNLGTAVLNGSLLVPFAIGGVGV